MLYRWCSAPLLPYAATNLDLEIMVEIMNFKLSLSINILKLKYKYKLTVKTFFLITFNAIPLLLLDIINVNK